MAIIFHYTFVSSAPSAAAPFSFPFSAAAPLPRPSSTVRDSLIAPPGFAVVAAEEEEGRPAVEARFWRLLVLASLLLLPAAPFLLGAWKSFDPEGREERG